MDGPSHSHGRYAYRWMAQYRVGFADNFPEITPPAYSLPSIDSYGIDWSKPVIPQVGSLREKYPVSHNYYSYESYNDVICFRSGSRFRLIVLCVCSAPISANFSAWLGGLWFRWSGCRLWRCCCWTTSWNGRIGGGVLGVEYFGGHWSNMFFIDSCSIYIHSKIKIQFRPKSPITAFILPLISFFMDNITR